jgi:hypothetical protein
VSRKRVEISAGSGHCVLFFRAKDEDGVKVAAMAAGPVEWTLVWPSCKREC